VEKAGLVFGTFRQGLQHYREHGLEGLDEHVRLAHRSESECDQVRRQVERDLFAKSLLPESREDIMGLLEHIDLVINQAEDVLRQIGLQRLLLPPAFQTAYADLAERSYAAGTALLRQANAALQAEATVRDLGDEVKACESRTDEVEQGHVAALFASALPLAEKLHYRDLVTMTATISDLAEDAANLLTVFSLKREA
jgi:predicted phosphate transport protein (TIGR00153 family)